MLTKVQYTDQLDRDNKIFENADKFLIEEQNTFEGNFLVFSEVKPLEVQMNEIKNNTDLIILKQEGLI